MLTSSSALSTRKGEDNSQPAASSSGFPAAPAASSSGFPAAPAAPSSGFPAAPAAPSSGFPAAPAASSSGFPAAPSSGFPAAPHGSLPTDSSSMGGDMGKEAPQQKKSALNPNAIAFVPMCSSAIGYEAAYMSSLAAPQTVGAPPLTPPAHAGAQQKEANNGRIMLGDAPEAVMLHHFVQASLAGDPDADGDGEVLDDHHDGACSAYSRGTSVRARGAGAEENDGHAAVAHDDVTEFGDDEGGVPFDACSHGEYDAFDEFLEGDEADDDYGHGANLTEEEMAWLESQCEARDNPPNFFW